MLHRIEKMHTCPFTNLSVSRASRAVEYRISYNVQLLYKAVRGFRCVITLIYSLCRNNPHLLDWSALTVTVRPPRLVLSLSSSHQAHREAIAKVTPASITPQ